MVNQHTPQVITEQNVTDLKAATELFQRQLILQALQHSQGSWSLAARQLGQDRANLARLAKRLGISVSKTVQY